MAIKCPFCNGINIEKIKIKRKREKDLDHFLCIDCNTEWVQMAEKEEIEE